MVMGRRVLALDLMMFQPGCMTHAVDGAHYRTLLKGDRRILNATTLGSNSNSNNSSSDSSTNGVVDCTSCVPDEEDKYEDTFLDAAHVVEAFAHSTVPCDIYFATPVSQSLHLPIHLLVVKCRFQSQLFVLLVAEK